MGKLAITVAFTATILLFASCSGHSDKGREQIVRIDSLVYRYPNLTGTEQQRILDQNVPALQALRHVMGADTIPLSQWLEGYSTSRAVTTFTPDVFRLLPSVDSVETQLYTLRQSLLRELPALKMPKVYGIVSPFNQSIMIVDTTALLIGLNHYLGPDYEGYRVFEPYQRYTKRAAFIPLDVAEALVASEYPYQEPSDGSSPTVLSMMLYQGALIEAKRRLLPDVDEAELMGYTPEQFSYLTRNEGALWESLISRNLLYSTDPMDITRLLYPAPATTLLAPDAPGRAARYIGYKIVKSSLAQHDVSLTELLSPNFYNNPQTLSTSKYQGR